MAIPTAAISGAVTIVIVSWLFRLAHRPVPTLPDGSIVVRYGRGMLAGVKFSPTSGQLVFVNRSGGKIRVGTLMSGLDQLITAARQRVPADVSRDALAKLEQRRSRGGV